MVNRSDRWPWSAPAWQRSGRGFESEPAIPLATNGELDLAEPAIFGYRRDRSAERVNIHLLPLIRRHLNLLLEFACLPWD